MYRLFRFCLATIALMASLLPLQAQAFFLNRIDIRGLHGISRDTVLSYLPVSTGQTFNPEQSSQIIDALYATGFFSNVSLQEQGSTLIINVVERATIGEVTVTGNKEIPKDKLDEILKKIGLVQGRLLDRSVLSRLVSQLRSQYDMMGKYSARVTPVILPQANNRVAIRIEISEGLTVQIGGISIIGNRVFSEKKLLSALPVSSTHFWSFLTNSDQYNQTKLSASLQALQSYYLDRGYLKFKADSTQVTLTPDRKTAYIIIHVTEGPLYKFRGYELAGRVLLDQGKLQSVLRRIKTGDAFSRQKVVDAEEGIKKALGDFGYIFSTVNTLPDVDEKNKTVFLTFYVDPGNQVYVRHINISGNLKTQDEVLRRLLRQQEGGLFSGSDMKESIRQLSLSGFLEGEPQVNTMPIPGYSDQVDLDLNINEAHAAQALFSLGYGTNGPVIGASLNQNNVFGTGNTLGLNFNNTRAATIYSVSYNNPYYTLDGVQRGFDLFFQRSTPSNLNTTTYSTNTYGGDLHYSIPFDAKGDTLQLSGGLQKLQLNLPPFSQLSTEVQNFVTQHGTQFNQLLLSIGWTRNSLDRLVFPEKGLYQSASAQLALPVGGKPLDYYKANYTGVDYLPLGHDFILQSRLNLGYGNGFASTTGLPFFANYYAGGIGVDGQVRGYEVSSLGPRDSNGYPLGGNVMAVGSMALIFPMPATVSEKLRTSVFVDAGNIYSTLGVTQPNNPRGGTASGPVRYSAGLDVDWRVPVFNVTLSFSVAKAINPKSGDQTQVFQFNIGTGF
ncbi:outer membrane protein assembly factor BamA [Candidatus Rickettsiella viridis]|uniref:Outer membrane protein assembly factor BamA n=1 Tax=Candidatus Rickettsiella viridis TaxID=676208 RepID=A0A2Z5UV39_9COXI|nr:outer membrane protein assembly factor BamA [Candidatus Rickettsiella viridis]BBB15344.1 outer membrane protein assembly factor BamA [Candidatus Rickettsiella viridis]